MNTFFKKTKVFWTLSRFVFVFLFGYALFELNKSFQLDWKTVLVDIFIGLDIIFLLVVGVYKAINKKYFEGMKIYTGTFSILYGLGVFYFLLEGLSISTTAIMAIGIFLGLWLLLYGLQELLSFRQKELCKSIHNSCRQQLGSW